MREIAGLLDPGGFAAGNVEEAVAAMAEMLRNDEQCGAACRMVAETDLAYACGHPVITDLCEPSAVATVSVSGRRNVSFEGETLDFEDLRTGWEATGSSRRGCDGRLWAEQMLRARLKAGGNAASRLAN